MLDTAGAFDIGEGKGGTGRDGDAGGDFPPLTELARGMLAIARGGFARLSFFTGEIFGADGTGFGGGDLAEIGEAGKGFVGAGGGKAGPRDKRQYKGKGTGFHWLYLN